jgi:hypothetical protein
MQDILFNFSNGTIFKNGDLNVGDCEQQNKELLLLCEKGSLKQYPITGVGLITYLEGEDYAAMLREIRNQFIADGMTVNALNFDGAQIQFDANY